MSRTTRLFFALYSAAVVYAFAPLNPTASLRPSVRFDQTVDVPMRY
jgi:hypothetical protein